VVVRKPRSEAGENDLKAFLKESLPPYMVPEGIEFRAELPRTYSDKIDREALLRQVTGSASASSR